MGQPVVHFEIVGKDGDALKRYYSELFGWRIDSDNPMDYGIVAKEENQAPDGSGIGGGVAGGPAGYDGHLTFYVAVDDCEAALAKAEELGGTRVMGPDPIPGMNLTIGQFTDPEGHLVGVLQVAGGGGPSA
jgi:predicted enzyme related to lactoylglutathione lyase